MKLLSYILIIILSLLTINIVSAYTVNKEEIINYSAYNGKIFDNIQECKIYEIAIKLADELQLDKDEPSVKATSPFSNGRINNSDYENFVNDIIRIIEVVNDKNYELNLSLIKKNVTIVSSDNYVECIGTSTEVTKSILQNYNINYTNSIFNKKGDIKK